ncbi:MAG TPA: hypothetical protein VMG35_28380 [Bryobacteraceae bacterium]|nr:hypothetical protein [Bryobacteraceae bacterium]
MESHVKILGTLHIVFGSLGLLVALGMLLLFGGIAGLIGATDFSENGHIAIPIVGSIGAIIFFVLLVLSLPGLIAGIGLLQFCSWARILTIVLSILDLIHVPIGTALGVYGLWVLLSPESERLFRVQGTWART